MNVVIGVRELRMAHVRTQIGNHNVQIFALVHPVVQPVGGKSMTKVIKTRGTSAGSRNTCFLQNQAESLLQPSLPVKPPSELGKNGSRSGIAEVTTALQSESIFVTSSAIITIRLLCCLLSIRASATRMRTAPGTRHWETPSPCRSGTFWQSGSVRNIFALLRWVACLTESAAFRWCSSGTTARELRAGQARLKSSPLP